ncbi:MAG: hypothetical protein CMM50_13370 [Rhodospirillaceae bacterium]|nr:hypothetical protein [Rhodospirillaceae bacterium]|tara:strand:- start:229 stop:615 length:387 start_codon:yes stop_codon:yes gene_type:complete
MHRRTFLTGAGAALIAAMALSSPMTVLAHHGWGWAEGEHSELTGKVTEVRLGNPHGELTLEVDGEHWVVEIGQPWRNERAGLTEDKVAPGTTVTAIGNRSQDSSQRLLKAVALVIDGKQHVLYPERMS